VRVLLIEDSSQLRRSLTTALRRSGYAVDASGDGEEGLWAAQSNPYDAVILDLMLPGLDGMTILQRLRQRGQSTPVLVLTARDTVDDRVRGLQAGADDYLMKPFALEELLARVQALCRRQYAKKNPSLVIGDLAIDTSARQVTLAGQPLELTTREYRLLEFLALRRGEVVSRTEIEEHIYDERASPLSNTVDSAISILRKKLGKAVHLQTQRMGYVLNA
jgi:DNA-binding response OmpR family regulator